MGGGEKGEGKERGRIRYGRRLKKCTEGQENEHCCVAMGDGKLGLATVSFSFILILCVCSKEVYIHELSVNADKGIRSPRM